eukprot:s590_g20.t1
MVKTTPWQDVPYTPKNALVGPRGLRKDQTKWKCTLSDLLKADNKDIVKLLVRDKLLIDMTGITCPRCGKGALSKLTKCQGDRWKHKCSSRNSVCGSAHIICTLCLWTDGATRLSCRGDAPEILSSATGLRFIFGNGTTWADVEADEATFDRRDISNDIQWKHLVKTKDSAMLLGYTVLVFVCVT